MPEPTDQPAKPLRTWRPMTLWTVGILLALGLAWFVGLVVVPVWQAHLAAKRCNVVPGDPNTYLPPERIAREIERLGGQAQAARKLGLYCRLPEFLSPYRSSAFTMITVYCRESSFREAVKLAGAAAPDIRDGAAWLLRFMDSPEAVQPLLMLLKDREPQVRRTAAISLGVVGSKIAVGALEAAQNDPDQHVRRAATVALQKLHDRIEAARGTVPGSDEPKKGGSGTADGPKPGGKEAQPGPEGH